MSMPEDQLRFQDSASREDLFNIALTATVHLLPKLFRNVLTKYAQDLSQTRGTLFALRFSPALQTRVSRTRNGHDCFQRRVRLDHAALVELVLLNVHPDLLRDLFHNISEKIMKM